MAIFRLLKDFNPDDYCLITQDFGDKSPNNNNYSCEKLPGKYYVLPAWLQIKRGWRFSAVRWANILMRAVQIARILKREKCSAVVATTSDLFDMPAAYIAGRLMQVRFYPYLFDYYSHKVLGKTSTFAHRYEPIMLKGAAGIIVPNEFMREEARSRYGVESTVIHNPCDLAAYESAPLDNPVISKDREIKIVYTGSIYEAHFSAFRNLVASIRLLDQWNIKLHIYTDQLASELDEFGICGPVVLHPPQATSAISEIQQKADILFLPLAFSSPYPDVVRTSAPGKIGEYLAAGRPVLVHAPPDTFLAWYFRQHACGLVVDESDPAKLATAIELLLTDSSLRDSLVAKARVRARADFSITASQDAFAELLELRQFHSTRELQPGVEG